MHNIILYNIYITFHIAVYLYHTLMTPIQEILPEESSYCCSLKVFNFFKLRYIILHIVLYYIVVHWIALDNIVLHLDIMLKQVQCYHFHLVNTLFVAIFNCDDEP